MSVNRSFENKLTHAFLSFLLFSHRLIQKGFGLFDYFFFVLSNKYYLSKLMLLDFRCQKISFLRKHNFCIDEKHTQWHWDTKVKVFHESISWFMKCPWNCISWMLWKKNFTVYPSLYINKKPCAATLQNCKIFHSYITKSTRKQSSAVL